MFDGFFIVGVETPEGPATYHYAIDPYWEMFDCKEVEHAPAWDGHTPQEAIARIEHWNQRAERTCRIVQHGHLFTLSDGTELYESACSECGAYLGDEDNYCSICGAKVVFE